jgi:hypothetical protein
MELTSNTLNYKEILLLTNCASTGEHKPRFIAEAGSTTLGKSQMRKKSAIFGVKLSSWVKVFLSVGKHYLSETGKGLPYKD